MKEYKKLTNRRREMISQYLITLIDSSMTMSAVTIFSLLIFVVSIAGCPETCECDFYPDEYLTRLSCPSRLNKRLQIDVSSSIKPLQSTAVDFLCFGGYQPDYSNLKELKAGRITSLTFSHCPLPSVSFLTFTEIIEDASLRQIHFESFKTLNDTLSKEHFHGLKDLTELKIPHNGLNKIPRDLLINLTPLTWFDLSGNFLTSLPTGIFSNVPQLLHLNLAKNRIKSLEPDTFTGLNHLQYLSLQGNRIKNIDDKLLSNLIALKKIDLRDNFLQNLSSDTFRDCVNLRHLSLSSNSFSNLPETLFQRTVLLQVVDLNYNTNNLEFHSKLFFALKELTEVNLIGSHIQNLPEDLFHGSSKLLYMSLNANQFTTLPEFLLKDMVNMEHLDLSNNYLEALPDGFFRYLTSLKTLKLHRNYLTEITRNLFTGLNNLEEINMEMNKLTHIDSNAFDKVPNLRKAYFSNNRLTLSNPLDFPSFNYLNFQNTKDLYRFERHLYLANNSISKFQENWRYLAVLDLSMNSIDKLSISAVIPTFANLINLSQNNISEVILSEPYYEHDNIVELTKFSVPDIRLQENPLHCDCMALELVLYSRGELLFRGFDQANRISENARCASPMSLKGRKIEDVHPKQLFCELKVCPEGCDCLYQPYTLGLVVNCTARGLTMMPSFLPEPANLTCNHTLLLLDNNNITVLPDDLWSRPGYLNVTELHLAGNKLAAIHAFTFNSTFISLDHNNLKTLNKDFMEYVEQNPFLRQLTLHSNPWYCNCSSLQMIYWLKRHTKFIDQSLHCSDGRIMSALTEKDVCIEESTVEITYVSAAWIAFIIVLSAVCGIIGAGAALYYKYKQAILVWLYSRRLCLWLVVEEELDKTKEYDAYVCFSQNDELFIKETLVPTLEGLGFRLCIHYRDWTPGEYIFDQIVRSVETSRRTLIVLSPNFLDSVWGKEEFRVAHYKALEEGRARVVMVIYGDMPSDLDPELQAYISVNTYVQWGDPWFWEKLLYALPHGHPKSIAS